MKYRILLTSISLFFYFPILLSQSYITDIEKDFFELYEKDSINYSFINGLCVIDSTTTYEKIDSYKNNLDSFSNSLPEKEKKERREKKRIKKIYNLIHKKYLKKYDERSYFPDIFKTGHYNCVTASALYVYIFEQLNIPYHIKEIPGHVFLIAYPNTYKIQIETTVPGAKGLFIPKKKEVEKIVKELLATKLVTQDEINNKGYEKVFSDFYFGEEFIDKSSLIGMQYYNKSIFDYTSKKPIPAFDNILISMKIYQNPLSKLVLKELVYFVITELDVSKPEKINSLFKVLENLELGKDIETYSINQLLYKIVSDNDNDLSYISDITKIFDDYKNPKIKELSLNVLYEYLATSHIKKLNYDEAIKFSNKLLSISENDKQAKEIITYAIYGKMVNLPYTEKNLLQLEQLFIKYPFFNNDKRTISLLAIYYGKLAEDSYRNRDENEGEILFNKFEDIMSNSKEFVQLNSQAVAQLYLYVGRFYYGKNKFVKAKSIFEKGLVYYPNHKELTKMLKWTIEDM